jgi:hypothetical protein
MPEQRAKHQTPKAPSASAALHRQAMTEGGLPFCGAVPRRLGFPQERISDRLGLLLIEHQTSP